ncbi:MAG: UDP-N-acetylmuramoyl-L-alanine--D-glutamate ligase [Acidobacteria bacterium]|nr:MAG: UDP-N-acetylmuramoyl-L-alanine--D-glutamate ligase [Acidobacteriota bacterium]
MRPYERDTTALIVGLGRSGRAAARFLLAEGCTVLATDRQPVERLDREVRALQAAGVTLLCGPDAPVPVERAQLVVASPGVPADSPPLVAARARGIPVVSEIDLVADRIRGRAIAITGSNGKSTTTALVAAMLAADGRDAVACGNYGVPLVDAVRDDAGARWYAVELSSFQLETVGDLGAAAAVLLNVQPDHLDRHGSLERYLELKCRVAALRAPGAPLVWGAGDPLLDRAVAALAEPRWAVSADAPRAPGAGVRDGMLVLAAGGDDLPLLPLDELPLPGRHNVVNALAAALASRAAGVRPDALREALRAFRPLPHRMCPVAQVGGVTFVDDSKATNVASTLAAIDAFAGTAGERLVVLLGGRDKGADFAPLAAAIAGRGARAVAFGEAGPLVARALEQAGAPPLALVPTMIEAIEEARRVARRGDVVLLSPACASFDEFTGYEERGRRFAEHVRSLSGAAS